MSTTLSLLRHEWRLQSRSLRFRFGLVLFLAVSALPALMLAIQATRQSVDLSPRELLADTLSVLPFTALLLGVVAAGNTARLEGERELLLSARMSGFGFLLRKVAALCSLVIPLTLLPLAVPLLLSLRLPGGLDGGVFVDALLSWLFWVLPRALVGVVGWLALVRVFRHEVGAFLVAVFAAPILLSLVNQGLYHLRIRLSTGDWTGFEAASQWAATAGFRARNGPRGMGSLPASESPFPVDLALQWLTSFLPLLAAFVLASFAAAAVLLGRSTRDVRPLALGPAHPLRTLALGLDRIRAAFRPDAGLTPRERGIAALCMAMALLLVFVPVARSRHFHALLAERYETEWQSPGEPTPPWLEPHHLKLGGELRRDGSVSVEAALTLRNTGAAPVEHLAFELNHGLEPDWRGDGGAIQTRDVRRAWHRLELDLATPVAPGSEVELVVHTTGRPVDYDIPLLGWNRAPFPARWEGLHAARFPREVSTMRPARVLAWASDRSVRLGLGELAPLPRYTSWQPVELDETEEEATQILEEQHREPVSIELDLLVPADWFLADPCGNVSQPVSGTPHARLVGECRVPLPDFVLLGGAFRPIGDGSGVALFGTRTREEGRARELLEAMERVASLSGLAWPGVPPVDRLVAVELPLDFEHRSRFTQLPAIEVHGQLLGVPELQLTWALAPIEARELVADVVLPRLPEPNPVTEERLLADQLLTAVLVRRMGLSEQTAAMSGRPWNRASLQKPLVDAEPTDRLTWRVRLPAVLFALETRVGESLLVDTLDEFLRRPDPEPASLRRWIERLAESTGTDLDDLWNDYIVGEALPELRVDDVAVRRERDSFVVRGRLTNLGSGETRCPMVVRTERGASERLVTVTSESSSPFEIRTRLRPHTLLLDPAETCLRFRPPVAQETFRLEGA